MFNPLPVLFEPEAENPRCFAEVESGWAEWRHPNKVQQATFLRSDCLHPFRPREEKVRTHFAAKEGFIEVIVTLVIMF